MTCRCGNEIDAAREVRGLPPVVLHHLSWRSTPTCEVRGHPQSDMENGSSRGEPLHRSHVQVVVVIVRDDDRVDGTDGFEG